MLETEKQEILLALSRGRDALGAAVAGVSDDLAVRKPIDGGWSILECVEHVDVSERYLQTRLSSATRVERPVANRVREGRMLERGVDRSRPVACPEGGWPRGRFGTISAALAKFDEARAETVKFVQYFDDDPRCWVTDHPVIPGPVNLMEILLTMAVHPARHAKQIEEIRTEIGAKHGAH
jgi:hypothetical protein